MTLTETGIKHPQPAVIKEQPGFEFESKSAVCLENPAVPLPAVMKLFHGAVAGNRLEGYSVLQDTPMEVRTPDGAKRTMYGWVDEKGNIHESLVVIEVNCEPKKYYVKRKGDPQINDTATLKRKETPTAITQTPDWEAFINKERETTNREIIKIADYRKEKVIFAIIENNTGRTFEVSLDRTYIDGRGNVPPLIQMEIEYAQTIYNTAFLVSPGTLEKSCDDLQKAFLTLQIEGVHLEPTQKRKVEWLYENGYAH